MTFPAGGGGGSTPAGGGQSSPTAPPSSEAPKPVPSPASGAEAQVDEGQASKDAGTSAAAAPPPPKVERPASFREALDRARTASVSEGDAPAQKAEETKPAPAPKQDAAPKAPEAPKAEETKVADAPAPEPKREAAPPAPKVEKPAALKVDAVSESDADVSDGEDDDALVEAAGKDDRTAFEERFPEADKGKKGPLDFAFRTARKNAELRPIAELVESVGGMDGAKLAFDYTKALTTLARPTATAEEAFEQAEGFREFLFKNAPGAYAKLENGIFWNAVADTPEGQANVQALVDEIFGDGVLTVEQMKTLGNAFADGRIDLDSLLEDSVDYTKTKQQREQEARRSKKESAEVAELREKVAKLEGNGKETEEAKAEARKAKVATAFTSFVADNFKLIQPILREYGFAYPDDPASPEFKSMARRIRHVQRDLEEVMEADDDYKSVVGNIANLQTDGVHAIQLGTARNKMRVALRGILDELAPEAAAEIKRKNRLVADRVKQSGKTPTTTAPAKPATAAPPRDASNSERAIDGEGRRQGMARMIEQGRRDQANA
jgi:hypothetical protein